MIPSGYGLLGAMCGPSRRQTREAPMRAKQVAITAAIALAVVVGFNAYMAKKG